MRSISLEMEACSKLSRLQCGAGSVTIWKVSWTPWLTIAPSLIGDYHGACRRHLQRLTL